MDRKGNPDLSNLHLTDISHQGRSRQHFQSKNYRFGSFFRVCLGTPVDTSITTLTHNDAHLSRNYHGKRDTFFGIEDRRTRLSRRGSGYACYRLRSGFTKACAGGQLSSGIRRLRRRTRHLRPSRNSFLDLSPGSGNEFRVWCLPSLSGAPASSRILNQ